MASIGSLFATLGLDNDEFMSKWKQSEAQVRKSNAKFGQAAKLMAKSFDKSKNSIKALTIRMRDLQKARDRSFNVKSIEKFNQKLAQTKARLTELKNKGLDPVKKSTTALGLSFKRIATLGAAAFGAAALISGIKATIKKVKEFAKSVSKLKAILGKGGTTGAMERLTKAAKDLGATTAFTATEVSGLQVEFAKLGFNVPEIEAATAATLDLAAASGTDLAEAARVAGATVRGFGLSTTETQRVVDVMAKSFSSSALDMEKFSTAMGVVAPVAKNAGANIEQVTAILGTLVDRGVDASTAGTALRNVFLELSKQGITWGEAMEKIRNSTDKNSTALKLFGKRGATVASIIADNADTIDDLKVALDGAEGSAKKMADTMLDNLTGDMIKAQSAWEGFILAMEDGSGTLAKLSRGITKFVTQAIGGLTKLSKSAKELIDTEAAEEAAEKLKQVFLIAKEEGVDELLAAQKALISSHQDLRSNVDILKSDFGGFNDTVGNTTDAFLEYRKTVNITREAFDVMRKTTLGNIAIQSKLSTSLKETITGLKNTSGSADDAEISLDDLGGTSLETEEKLSKAAKAAKKLADEMDRIANKVKPFDALAETAKRIADEAEKAKDNIQDLVDVVTSGLGGLPEMDLIIRPQLPAEEGLFDETEKEAKEAGKSAGQKFVDGFKPMLAEIAEATIGAVEQATSELIVGLSDAIVFGNEELNSLKEELKLAQEEMAGLTKGTEEYIDKAEEIVDIKAAIADVDTSVGSKLKEFAINILSFFQELGAALIASGVGMIIAVATAAEGTKQIVAGGIMVAAATAGKGVINSLAEGGIVSSPMLSVVGDARTPELITPLHKLPGLMDKMGGGGNQVLTTRLDNQDILFTLKAGMRNRERNA